MIVTNAAGKEVLKKPVKADRTGRGGLLANFEKPGAYQVEVRNADGTKIGKGVMTQFVVGAEYGGIETEAPLVGGEPIDSNRFTGKRLSEFDVVLRWKPLVGRDEYQVLVKNRDGQSLVDQKVKGTNFAFPKGKIYSEALVYQIRAEYPNGYVAVSKSENFLFNFNSPALTLPAEGTIIKLSDPTVGAKGIIFTWQRTTFTQGYLFEMSSDEAFSSSYKQASIKENFLVYRGLKPGTYWWRVRSLSQGMKSPPGHPFKITVTP